MDQVEKNSASSGLITTSHNPSHFLRKLSKLLTFCLPNTVRINRGSLNKKQLFNYCWNNQISRLMIVQGLEKKDSGIIEIYKLERSLKPINALIEVSDVTFPNKGVKDARIESSGISLHYSTDFPIKLRESIESLLKPFLISSTKKKSESVIEMNFTHYESHEIKGNFLRQGKGEKYQLLIFRITLLNKG